MDQVPHRPPVPRSSLLRLLAIGVIASAGGIALGLWIPWFPAQASSQAHKIDTLYRVLIVVTVPIFVLVECVVLYSVVRFRMRPGEEALDGAPIHGNTRLEVIWTAVPAMIIAGLVIYAFVVLQQIEKKPAHEVDINVTGQQFAWSFRYPATAPGGQPIVSDELYLAVNQPVRFRLHSADVIHSFWVPAFRVQEDAVPGVTTSYRITPTRLGTYDVVCNELCGLGHSLMRSTVHVVTPAAYTTWLNARGASSSAPANGSPAQIQAMGKSVFTGSGGCSACHTLADAGAAGQIGPNLDHYLKGRTAAFIHQMIVNPNGYIEKGFAANIMPGNFSTSLSPAEINAVVAYLVAVATKR